MQQNTIETSNLDWLAGFLAKAVARYGCCAPMPEPLTQSEEELLKNPLYIKVSRWLENNEYTRPIDNDIRGPTNAYIDTILEARQKEIEDMSPEEPLWYTSCPPPSISDAV